MTACVNTEWLWYGLVLVTIATLFVAGWMTCYAINQKQWKSEGGQ